MSIPQPPRITCVRRNYRDIDLHEFRRRLLESDVYVNPSSSTNEYARQLGDCIVAILDDIAPSKMITKRRGKPTAGWMSKEAADARRERRRLERRYRRTKTESDRKDYPAGPLINSLTNREASIFAQNFLKPVVIPGNGGASQTICYTTTITVPRSTLMTIKECATNSVSSLLTKSTPLRRP